MTAPGPGGEQILSLTYTGDDLPPGEIEEHLISLRRELEDLGAIAVVRVPPSAAPPPGAKGVAEAVGTLAVTLAKSPEKLASFIEAARGWLAARRRRSGSIRIVLDGDELEITSPSPAQQDQLVAAFITRHTGHK